MSPPIRNMTFPEGNILPFPTLQLLQSYAEDVNNSISNPTLQSSQVNFLLMNATAILDALKVADNANATIVDELTALKETHVKLEVRCSQTYDNNLWLNERYNEARKANVDLIEKQKQLESELSIASDKEKKFLERIAWMEQAIRKLSGLIVRKRIGSYRLIELWANHELSEPLDETAEEEEEDNGDKLCSQDQDARNIAAEMLGEKVDEKAAPVPTVSHSSSPLTEKLWDDTFSNTIESEGDASGAESCDAVSKAASDMSVFTDIVKYRMAQTKTSREVIDTAEKDRVAGTDFQHSQSVADIANSNPVENNVPINEAASISGTDSAEHDGWNVASKEFAVQAPSSNSKIDNSSIDLPGRFSDITVPQEDEEPQFVNTCKDNTRYADIACDYGGGFLSYADSINPQVVVADPDEVAGDWNDVPVPVELRRTKVPEKSRKTSKPSKTPRNFERNVLVVGLPPTITIAMIATFVRGGKIEKISIVNEGNREGVQNALISFFSRRAARKFHQWIKEHPRLVIDCHTPNAFLVMTVPPPVIPLRGGSRVVIINNVPKEIQSNDAFYDFISKAAAWYHHKISIQETRFWPVTVRGEERGFAGAVIFDSYHVGLEMGKILEQRMKLEVIWGHDRCEEPLVREKQYKFIENKEKKQHDAYEESN